MYIYIMKKEKNIIMYGYTPPGSFVGDLHAGNVAHGCTVAKNVYRIMWVLLYVFDITCSMLYNIINVYSDKYDEIGYSR